MDDIVIAYISPDIESQMRERILEVLRMRMIQTTTNKEQATVFITTPNQIPGPGLPLSELAEKTVQQTVQEIVELKDLMYEDIPHKTQKPKHTKPVYALKQYKQTKQRQKRMFFNRTKCK